MENQVGNLDTEIKKLVSFLEKLYSQFEELPFGNSDFQNKYFVINAQYTPARAFRSLCLYLRDRINSLLEAYYGLKKEDIDIEELEDKLKTEKNIYEKRRIELDIEFKKLKRIDIKKLVDDAIHEVNYLLNLYNQFPTITREEFESEEEEYFKKKLTTQLIGDGNLMSLLSMGYMVDENGNLIEANDKFKYNVFETIKEKQLKDADR